MPFFNNANDFIINGGMMTDIGGDLNISSHNNFKFYKAAGDCGVNVVPGSNLINSEQHLIFSVLTLLSVRHITQLTVLMLHNVTRERVQPS